MFGYGAYTYKTEEITKEEYDRCWNKGPEDRYLPGYMEDGDLTEKFGIGAVVGYGLTAGKAYEENGRYYIRTKCYNCCD